jgi:short-subunit dehydrogenase
MAASLRVLIAGVGGIGGALARRLVARGTAVHLVARSEAKLGALADELRARARARGSADSSVTVSVADLAVEAEAERAAREAAAAGPLTGLVYAVGSIPLKPFKATTAKDYMDAYALNFIGGAALLRASLPALTANAAAPGSAVFFSTVAARVGFPNHAAIAAAKGAVEAFVRSTAAELAPKVRVNCIAPSLSDTPLAARMTSNEAVKKALADAHPLPRLGTADDGAAAAEFLLDDKWSGWVTGQTWSVDGGRSTLRHKN